MNHKGAASQRHNYPMLDKYNMIGTAAPVPPVLDEKGPRAIYTRAPFLEDTDASLDMSLEQHSLEQHHLHSVIEALSLHPAEVDA